MIRITVARACAAILMVLITAAGSERALALEFSFLVGDVSLLRQGKSSAAGLGQSLADGDMVMTGAGGIAVIGYGDGSEIRVMEKSRVRIGSIAVKDSGSVSVISGAINARFQKLARGSERKVVTPTTVCSVRGTDFLVGVSDGADSRVEMKEGALEVRNPYGRKNLGPSSKTKIGLAESPADDEGEADMAAWKAERDGEMERDPGERGKRFEGYINNMGERSSRSSGKLGDLNSRLGGRAPVGKKEIEKTGEELTILQRDLEDDALLNESAAASIEGILDRFGKDKTEMYDTFYRIKEESNKVAQQHRINFEALQAVRESYRKAYEEIMGKHRESMEKIKGGIDKEAAKPPKK